MLMMGDNYWLQMPKSRRPIRITPMQKLLGEASIGDISTLTWSQDYQGEWKATETTSVSGKSIATYHLVLTAKTAGASYQKIDLWLAKQDAFPIKADLYLRSGKLAKQAHYRRATKETRDYVSEMTLLDSIQPSKNGDRVSGDLAMATGRQVLQSQLFAKSEHLAIVGCGRGPICDFVLLIS